MILYAKGRQFLKSVLILAVLAGAVTPARAETDLTLTTRFIQGSFDILLPDGWVAALTADGRAMEAQSPERHKLSINARVHNADEVAQAREFHLRQLRDSDLLNVEFVGAHRLLDGRLTITVVRPYFTEESGMGEHLEPKDLTHHILASYHAQEPDNLWLDAGVVVFGEDPLDESWIDFLVATLESVRVPEQQSWGGSLYRRLKDAPPVVRAEADDLLGSWSTRKILGTTTFAATDPDNVVLADFGLEKLTILAAGRYESTWSGVFMALEGGDLVTREGEHRESGRWTLQDGVLLLSPEEAEGRSFEDRKDKGEFLPVATPPRRYDVTFRAGLPVLRGACPVFAEMQYCEDLYTGGRRVLDFILEPGS